MQTSVPEIGKTYISNIPDAPDIAVRVKAESLVKIAADPVLGFEAHFVVTCSFPDEPDVLTLDLASDEWAASGFSPEVH